MSHMGSNQRGSPSPIHTVTVCGNYGAVNWTACKELWDILPAAKRIAALDASSRLINPFFVKLVDDLLERVGSKLEAENLVSDWSLEAIEYKCTFGAVLWQVGQGVWEQIPADRHDNLLKLMEASVHHFFHQRIVAPLMAYATKNLPH